VNGRWWAPVPHNAVRTLSRKPTLQCKGIASAMVRASGCCCSGLGLGMGSSAASGAGHVCSPGSKTFQLLEMLHDMDGASKGSGSASTPSGFVVANDADAQRCNLLTHQTKRMCSPCLIITSHYGEQFPAISSAALDSAAAAVASAAARGTGGSSDQAAAAAAAAAAAQSSDKGVDLMLFDRILCDVPCSGDGTMRKAPDIWRRWSVVNGNGLHCMQLKIALQAVRLRQGNKRPS